MISLISRWVLKAGCPDELIDRLQSLPDEVISSEPGTISYRISLPTPPPGGASTSPPAQEPSEVVFQESYANDAAFDAHVNGAVFTKFREDCLEYFEPDPAKPGWPKTITTFLRAVAGAHQGAVKGLFFKFWQLIKRSLHRSMRNSSGGPTLEAMVATMPSTMWTEPDTAIFAAELATPRLPVR